jgi:hypothetical protein
VLGLLLDDAASPASHQRALPIYAAALAIAAAFSVLLPGRAKNVQRSRNTP